MSIFLFSRSFTDITWIILIIYLSGPWTCQLRCGLCRVRKLSDFINNILICVPKRNKRLTGLERHEASNLWQNFHSWVNYTFNIIQGSTIFFLNQWQMCLKTKLMQKWHASPFTSVVQGCFVQRIELEKRFRSWRFIQIHYLQSYICANLITDSIL